MKSPIIVPLDGMTVERSLALAEQLAGSVWGFKVNDLLVTEGVRIVTELKRFGQVFADPKLHDIPNTVGNGVKALAAAGADLITVHGSGGRAMLEAAVRNAGPAKILAVTVLTSLTDADAEQLYSCSAREGVARFANLAASAGVHGIVCSPQELSLLQATPALVPLLKVTPGVRPTWSGKDDQARTLTPAEAMAGGATHLVIGRPITGHENPVQAVKLINEEVGAL